MKTIPVALATKNAARGTTFAFALKVSRPDGEVFGFTSASRDSAPISGVTYQASPGMSVSQIVQSASFAVDNLSLTTLNDGAVFTKLDILSGVWKDATFELFKYDYLNEAGGIEPVLSGVFGQPQIQRSQVTVELRDVKQYGQQTLGAPSTKTCRNRFARFDGVSTWCQLDASDFTFHGTVTSVVNAGEFFDASRTDADDYFGNGVLTWSAGTNLGLQCVVKVYEASTDGGRFVLDLPMFKGIEVGDAFIVEAGCRKRREEDCVTKFANVLDFNGEPDRPLVNSILQNPTPSV